MPVARVNKNAISDELENIRFQANSNYPVKGEALLDHNLGIVEQTKMLSPSKTSRSTHVPLTCAFNNILNSCT